MAAHLLVLYPHPKNAEVFDRAYREEHLPYAGPRLERATSVVTKRVVGPTATALSSHLGRDLSNNRYIEGMRHLERWSGSLGARQVDQLRRRSNDGCGH